MEIKQAGINDINGLAKLFDLYRIFYGKKSDVESARTFLANRIENKESIIYLAMKDSKTPLGFVQLYPLFSSTRMKRLWLLNDLFVEEMHRGLGISKLLIDKSKWLARETNAAGLILETAKSNTIGNNLYPKTGFVLDSDHNFYEWEV